jgi:hypothetical protein
MSAQQQAAELKATIDLAAAQAAAAETPAGAAAKVAAHSVLTTGIHGATATPTANRIPIAGGDGKLDEDWLPGGGGGAGGIVIHEGYAAQVPEVAPGNPHLVGQFSLAMAYAHIDPAARVHVLGVEAFADGPGEKATTITVTIAGIGGHASKVYSLELPANDHYASTTLTDEFLTIDENDVTSFEAVMKEAYEYVPTSGLTVRLITCYKEA